jgi:hypothetical protein
LKLLLNIYADIIATGACVFFTFHYTMDISGKNNKMGGTNWNPRMVMTGAKEEIFYPNAEALEAKKRE